MLTKKTTETFFDIDGVDVRMKLRWKNLHLSNRIFCVHVPFGWINNVMYYTMEMPLVEFDHVTTLMAGPFALISRQLFAWLHTIQA